MSTRLIELCEYVKGTSGLTVDCDKGVIRGVKFLGWKSAKDCRYNPSGIDPSQRRRWPTWPAKRQGGPWIDQREEAPTGPRGRALGRRSYAVPRRANLPRWVFTKRASAPLAATSRSIAEYNVAAGVLPPGEVQ